MDSEKGSGGGTAPTRQPGAPHRGALLAKRNKEVSRMASDTCSALTHSCSSETPSSRGPLQLSKPQKHFKMGVK